MNIRLSIAILIATLLILGCDKGSTQVVEVGQAAADARESESTTPLSQSPVSGPDLVTTSLPASEVLGADHSSLLALSAEEAAWLNRHGYPTEAELDALMTYDVDELSSATRNQKSQKAAALLGHRKMAEGDLDGAWTAFSVGAELGSLHAMQQMAIVSAHRATGLPIDQLAQADQGVLGVMVARLEVARMLGDHRAQELIDRYGVNFDWDYYGKHVLAQTATFMDYYGEFARARGERVRGPDPRPNAEAWAKLEADPDALVTVYTRGSTGP